MYSMMYGEKINGQIINDFFTKVDTLSVYN